jgi:hypothetical protein
LRVCGWEVLYFEGERGAERIVRVQFPSGNVDRVQYCEVSKIRDK